jgi:hypothetical protein
MAESEFPGLFCHQTRADWGVSVLLGERDGKRRYLFEGGEERTMAAAQDHLMQQVEQPDRTQQESYARLMAVLGKREPREAPTGSQGTRMLLEQLEKFRVKYPEGLSSEAWQSDVRNVAARRAREGSAPALKALSGRALEALVKSNQLEGVWNQVVSFVSESGLASDGLATAPSNEHQRVLSEAIRDLLHGSDRYERRFDRFVMRYETVFHTAPSWQAVTALSALVFPAEHVCVEPTAFRLQLKAFSRQSTLGVRPTGATYVRCQAMARALASGLAEQGEVPADLLEVNAFIRAMAELSRRGAARARPAKPAPSVEAT